MKRLRVHTQSRAYGIFVCRDRLVALGKELARCCPGGRVVVCSDENVAPLYLHTASSSLRAAGYDVSYVVLPAGEREKTLRRAEELYGVLYDRGIRRSDTVVALGGGVIGDLTGFVAATYQRGVRFVQVPTTLLAQVDASVGGKVAVDFRAGKNYVGSFYQPHLVFVALQTLTTLPERELRSGAAEVAKHGLLAGGDALLRVERLASAPLAAARITETLVVSSIRFKVGVVEEDEREGGRRAVLNLGHTIGHALEAATGFARYSHGEAVALGLRAAVWLSQRVCGLGDGEADRAYALLDGLGLPSRVEGVRADEVCALVGKDKKAGNEGVGYVLLERCGAPVAGVAVPSDLEREAVEWLLRN